MREEKLSIVPGFDHGKKSSTGKVLHEPRKRFIKAADNADHQHTLRMREIKATLRLTTAQLVRELNSYEREHQSTNFQKRTDPNTPAWLPMTTVLMSSYLQGWVVQEGFMALILKRLENLFKFMTAQGAITPQGGMRTIMDGWYSALGIDSKDASISPSRQLARMIAPYYKRPLLANVSGVFHLGPKDKELQVFDIVDADNNTHTFFLNPKEPVLIKDGQNVKIRDVIQYSVLMQTRTTEGESTLSPEPSVDHTTFFRWYSNNKMPRSIKTVQLVQTAVDKAVESLKSNT